MTEKKRLDEKGNIILDKKALNITINTDKKTFNSYLLEKSKKNKNYEVNSGEVLLDTTGYIDLKTLYNKCVISRMPLTSEWPSIDINQDKYTDVFDGLKESQDLLSSALEKVEEKAQEKVEEKAPEKVEETKEEKSNEA